MKQVLATEGVRLCQCRYTPERVVRQLNGEERSEEGLLGRCLPIDFG
jgi:hypothetical protein